MRLFSLLGSAFTYFISFQLAAQTAQNLCANKFTDGRQVRLEASLSITLSNEEADSELETDSRGETEPRHCGKTPGGSIWMTWKPPPGGVVEIETVSKTSGFMPLVGLYTCKNLPQFKNRKYVCGQEALLWARPATNAGCLSGSRTPQSNAGRYSAGFWVSILGPYSAATDGHSWSGRRPFPSLAP